MLAVMRISLELVPAESDRLEGRIVTKDGADLAFSGTLDLLRVLEELLRAQRNAAKTAASNAIATPSQNWKERSSCR